MKRSVDLLPGTLDLLVLRTLVRGPLHGYGIAQRVKALSRDVLQVGESSLYPALQRLALNGYVKAEWGASENNRRARYYTLTATAASRSSAPRPGQPASIRSTHVVGLTAEPSERPVASAVRAIR